MTRNLSIIFLFAFGISGPTASAQIVESVPRIKEASDTSPVTQIFRATPRQDTSNAPRASAVILRLEISDTVVVGRPFRILLRAYDPLGLPAVSFTAPVTYESISGVIPIISRAKWLNGLLEDTLIITRPGKNVRLAAVAGGALATLHLDVESLPLTKERWLDLAEGHLAEGRFDAGVDALKRASDERDPAIERRLGRLYLEKGMWADAEIHYLRAMRAATR